MEPCPICQKEVTFRKLYERFDFEFKNKYHILECPLCRIRRTLPIPQDLSFLYQHSEYSKPQQGLYHALKGVLLRHEIRRIHSITKSKEFLDMGSGHGDFAENCFRLGYSVVAADGSPRRPYYIQSIDQVPYAHFDFKKNQIDLPEHVKARVVVLRHVLEHIEDPLMFLQKFIDNKADFFYIAVPNFDRFERILFRQYDLLLGLPYHLWHFNKTSLKNLLGGLGLEIMKIGYDTIPTVWHNIDLFLRTKKYPKFLISFIEFPPIKTPLWLTLNILSPNNVIWVVAKTPQHRSK